MWIGPFILLVHLRRSTDDWGYHFFFFFNDNLNCTQKKIYFIFLQNDKLWISIYECGWENHLSRKSKRIILNGLTQGLIPMKMTAGAFFVFSMQTYLSVRAILLINIFLLFKIINLKSKSQKNLSIINKTYSSLKVIKTSYSYFALLTNTASNGAWVYNISSPPAGQMAWVVNSIQIVPCYLFYT